MRRNGSSPSPDSLKGVDLWLRLSDSTPSEPTDAGQQRARALLPRPSACVYVGSSRPSVVSVLQQSSQRPYHRTDTGAA